MMPSVTQRAVDEKFCALEKKEQELQQLRVSMRERGSDLERLRSVLCSNEATIHVSAGPAQPSWALGTGCQTHLPVSALGTVSAGVWPPLALWWGRFLGHSCLGWT